MSKSKSRQTITKVRSTQVLGFEINNESANTWFDVSNIALLIGALFVVAGTYGVFKFGSIKEKYADERISSNEAKVAESRARAEEAIEHSRSLEIELEKARNDAKQIDANLLREQRLTARERMRLEKLERIVLPRILDPSDGAALVAAFREANFSPVNVFSIQGAEPEAFAISIVAVLAPERLLGQFGLLPKAAQPPSLIVVAIDDDGEMLADLLFQRFKLGQGYRVRVQPGSDAARIDRSLIGVTTDRNSIVVGSNSTAALQPSPGQPGEGIDERGRPVPAP